MPAAGVTRPTTRQVGNGSLWCVESNARGSIPR